MWMIILKQTSKSKLWLNWQKVFDSVWMWELDYKESWVLKNWCFWTVVLEKTLKSPLDCKEIQPVHPKGDQSWVFTGRTDVEAETPILCPPDAKTWLFEKILMLGKIEGRRRGNRGWDAWMASLTQWTWVWVNSGSWWWAGRPGMLRFIGLQRVGHNWATELNSTEERNRMLRFSGDNIQGVLGEQRIVKFGKGKNVSY